jgi:hypothetical protein
MSALGKTEWAHALAGGLSVRGAEGSLGQRPNVPEAGISRLRSK